jgi:hypothetical protein
LSIVSSLAVLTDVQYAVVFNRVEVAAELIDCGAEVDSLTVQANGWTALQQAAFFKELDIVRFLLQRGASPDLLIPGGDLPNWTCWYLDDRQTEHSSMDIFNLLCESVCPDMLAVNAYGSTSLHIAASNANGGQIDSPVSLGSDIHLQTHNGMFPIHYAIHNGNFWAFSSLVLHYDEDIFEDPDRIGWSLLHWTVGSKAVYLDEIRRDVVIDSTGPREYDEILREVLQRGVSPQARHRRESWWLEAARDLQGREVTAHELAVAYGPEVEASFLGVLRTCRLLVADDDINRLLDLESEGYGIECEDDFDSQSESLICDGDSDFEGDDQFWDAEELSVDR